MISNFISIFQSPQMTIAEKIMYVLFYVFCILFSLIIHEVAHGWVALKCGTAGGIQSWFLSPVSR